MNMGKADSCTLERYVESEEIPKNGKQQALKSSDYLYTVNSPWWEV